MKAASIDLEARLIERTVDQRNEVIARAEERARRILQVAEAECERIRAESDEQILNIVGSELRAIRDRIVGKAEIEGRKMLMLARERALSDVFEEAEKSLKEIAEWRDERVNYGEVLTKMLVEAISAMGGDEFIVSANERDLSYLKKQIGEIKDRMKEFDNVSILLDEKPIEAIGGVIVRNRDGTKTYHNTLEGRLLKARSRIEAEVARILGVI